jgi:hypothetical protein
MEFNELIAGFAARYNVEGLAVEDGAAAIEADGIAVLLAAANGVVLATSEIGEPPPDGASAFADLLLEANLDSDAFFAKSKESGRYLLGLRLPLAALDAEAFDAAFEAFVSRAEAWRKLLANYRPAAADAAKAEAADAAAIAVGGFLKV